MYGLDICCGGLILYSQNESLLLESCTEIRELCPASCGQSVLEAKSDNGMKGIGNGERNRRVRHYLWKGLSSDSQKAY